MKKCAMSKKFIISEKEKNRISNIHNKRILMEREGEQTAQQPTTAPQQPTTAPQQPTQQATTQPTTSRYQTAVCPAGKVRCDQTVLRAQIRMNDECGLTVKLVEDGIKGDKTTEAWTVCKPKLKPKVQATTNQTQGTQTQTNVAQTTAPISPTDIATLTA